MFALQDPEQRRDIRQGERQVRRHEHHRLGVQVRSLPFVLAKCTLPVCSHQAVHTCIYVTAQPILARLLHCAVQSITGSTAQWRSAYDYPEQQV